MSQAKSLTRAVGPSGDGDDGDGGEDDGDDRLDGAFSRLGLVGIASTWPSQGCM